MKKMAIVVAAIVALFVVAAALWITWEVLIFGPRTNVVIAKDFSIDNQWREITPAEPLIVRKDEQSIALRLSPPLTIRSIPSVHGIKSPTSDHPINPEIKLIDETGKEYDLTYNGGWIDWTGEYATYGADKRLSRQLRIKEVMIRSDVPLTVREILWSGFDWEDRK